MGRINLGRVILGGLVAGVLINLSQTAVNMGVLAGEMQAVEASTGRQAGMGAIVTFMVVGFVVGIVVTWLYAAMRPRFGAGPRTAALAGLIVWVLAAVYAAVVPAAAGIASMRSAVIWGIWTLVELPLAAMLGAWLYREPAGVGVPGATARV